MVKSKQINYWVSTTHEVNPEVLTRPAGRKLIPTMWAMVPEDLEIYDTKASFTKAAKTKNTETFGLASGKLYIYNPRFKKSILVNLESK